jgi:hypothetical protein
VTRNATIRHTRRRSLLATTLAPYGFILIGFALGSGVVPVRYPGPLVVVTFALALATVVAGDFVRGESRWPAALRETGDHTSMVARWVTLHGPSARLQTGRFLLLSAVAITGALYEWTHRGWTDEFFGPGPGIGALIVLVGVFFSMGALSGLLHRAEGGLSGRLRAVGVVFLVIQLCASLGVIAIGWVEANERGAIASLARSLNPFERAAAEMDLR